MKLDLTIIQIALIFFPGIIWAAVHRSFCAKRQISDLHFLVQCFVFGVISYVVTFGVYSVFSKVHPVQSFLSNPTNAPVGTFTVSDLLLTTGVALALSIAWTFFVNHKVASRILRCINATKRYGDEDVWDFTFNSSEPYVEYVHVRDFEKKIVYSGWVQLFSESEKTRELLLRGAQVYDFEGTLMYEMPYIYLAREAKDIQIDFPYKKDS